MIIWVVKIFFVQLFCVFFPPLLNLSLLLSPCYFCPLLCPLCMKCSLCISNFLKEISGLSHSIVFLYFLALIAEEGFLISPCYSLELCIQMDTSFLFFFAFCFSFFPLLFIRPPQTTILPFFFLGMVLIPAFCTMSRASVHNYSGTLSIRSRPLNLFLTSTV